MKILEETCPMAYVPPTLRFIDVRILVGLSSPEWTGAGGVGSFTVNCLCPSYDSVLVL